MQSGKLNRRVQFQRASITPDALGENDTAFVTYYTCWAAIVPKNAPLLYQTGEFTSRPVVEITIRWPGATIIVQSGDRIVYVQQSTGITHTYETQSFDNTEQRNRELVILAYEINPQE